MKSHPLLRLEWISLVYLALFVLAVLSPSLVKRDFFGLNERHVEEILIFLFGITGLTIFSIYQRLMEKSEQEHQDAKNEYERAKRELIESYRYIGEINRKIEVLKRLANQTSLKFSESGKLTKELLLSLLSSAAASANCSCAFIRFVNLEKLRTEHETNYICEPAKPFRVSNKQLLRLHETGAPHSIITSEEGQSILVVPADHEGRSVKAFFMFALGPHHDADVDSSLLKVFANQAGFLYYSLEGKDKFTPDPLELVAETEKQVVGVVEG